MTRIILLGRGSFIAKAVAKAATERAVDYLALTHDAALDGLTPDDCLINFSIAPAYRTAAYDAAADLDLRAASLAARADSHFIMLSTRRVYGQNHKWNSSETAEACGDQTTYGQNKATSEKKISTMMGRQAGIFRLSNIFGYEYEPKRPRKSFAGILLGSLKNQSKILFDMSAKTRRDFLPVEICADLLLDRALDRTTGIYNLGSGFPVSCGSIADWICKGYGGGALICEPDEIRDEFYLNTGKWRADFGLQFDQSALQEYCIALGRRLKCEQS